MISYTEASLERLSIHKVGNKQLGEGLVLSPDEIQLSEDVLNQLLLEYFISKFEKVNNAYRFNHSSGDLSLNEVHQFCARIFENPESFQNTSELLAKFLYDVSVHPNIKAGELCVAYLRNVQVDGELFDAIGIFKSEDKEPFLKIRQSGDQFELNYEQDAINIRKLDKGCLVFNTKEEGFRVFVIDANRTEAFYWVDQFLQLAVLNNNYSKTQQVLTMYKNFVTENLDEHYTLERTDKIDMLNRSINYFKDREHFEIDEFSNEVIGDPGAVKLFQAFKQEYEKTADVETGGAFDISSEAVKKQARQFKSILKLDRNFHIYIHGNKELIEKGYDEGKRMNYYKVYFTDES